MHYTYVLLSGKDGRLYTGTSADLRARFREHQAGQVRSTSYGRPWRLIYYEACLDGNDAFRRERFLKTGKGKRYLRNRLSGFLSQVGHNKLERH